MECNLIKVNCIWAPQDPISRDMIINLKFYNLIQMPVEENDGVKYIDGVEQLMFNVLIIMLFVILSQNFVEIKILL